MEEDVLQMGEDEATFDPQDALEVPARQEISQTSLEIMQLLAQCEGGREVFGNIHEGNFIYDNASLVGSSSELSDIFQDNSINNTDTGHRLDDILVNSIDALSKSPKKRRTNVPDCQSEKKRRGRKSTQMKDATKSVNSCTINGVSTDNLDRTSNKEKHDGNSLSSATVTMPGASQLSNNIDSVKEVVVKLSPKSLEYTSNLSRPSTTSQHSDKPVGGRKEKLICKICTKHFNNSTSLQLHLPIHRQKVRLVRRPKPKKPEQHQAEKTDKSVTSYRKETVDGVVKVTNDRTSVDHDRMILNSTPSRSVLDSYESPWQLSHQNRLGTDSRSESCSDNVSIGSGDLSSGRLNSKHHCSRGSNKGKNGVSTRSSLKTNALPGLVCRNVESRSELLCSQKNAMYYSVSNLKKLDSSSITMNGIAKSAALDQKSSRNLGEISLTSTRKKNARKKNIKKSNKDNSNVRKNKSSKIRLLDRFNDETNIAIDDGSDKPTSACLTTVDSNPRTNGGLLQMFEVDKEVTRKTSKPGRTRIRIKRGLLVRAKCSEDIPSMNDDTIYNSESDVLSRQQSVGLLPQRNGHIVSGSVDIFSRSMDSITTTSRSVCGRKGKLTCKSPSTRYNSQLDEVASGNRICNVTSQKYVEGVCEHDAVTGTETVSVFNATLKSRSGSGQSHIVSSRDERKSNPDSDQPRIVCSEDECIDDVPQERPSKRPVEQYRNTNECIKENTAQYTGNTTSSPKTIEEKCIALEASVVCKADTGAAFCGMEAMDNEQKSNRLIDTAVHQGIIEADILDQDCESDNGAAFCNMEDMDDRPNSNWLIEATVNQGIIEAEHFAQGGVSGASAAYCSMEHLDDGQKSNGLIEGTVTEGQATPFEQIAEELHDDEQYYKGDGGLCEIESDSSGDESMPLILLRHSSRTLPFLSHVIQLAKRRNFYVKGDHITVSQEIQQTSGQCQESGNVLTVTVPSIDLEPAHLVDSGNVPKTRPLAVGRPLLPGVRVFCDKSNDNCVSNSSIHCISKLEESAASVVCPENSVPAVLQHFESSTELNHSSTGKQCCQQNVVGGLLTVNNGEKSTSWETSSLPVGHDENQTVGGYPGIDECLHITSDKDSQPPITFTKENYAESPTTCGTSTSLNSVRSYGDGEIQLGSDITTRDKVYPTFSTDNGGTMSLKSICDSGCSKLSTTVIQQPVVTEDGEFEAAASTGSVTSAGVCHTYTEEDVEESRKRDEYSETKTSHKSPTGSKASNSISTDDYADVCPSKQMHYNICENRSEITEDLPANMMSVCSVTENYADDRVNKTTSVIDREEDLSGPSISGFSSHDYCARQISYQNFFEWKLEENNFRETLDMFCARTLSYQCYYREKLKRNPQTSEMLVLENNTSEMIDLDRQACPSMEITEEEENIRSVDSIYIQFSDEVDLSMSSLRCSVDCDNAAAASENLVTDHDGLCNSTSDDSESSMPTDESESSMPTDETVTCARIQPFEVNIMHKFSNETQLLFREYHDRDRQRTLEDGACGDVIPSPTINTDNNTQTLSSLDERECTMYETHMTDSMSSGSVISMSSGVDRVSDSTLNSNASYRNFGFNTKAVDDNSPQRVSPFDNPRKSFDNDSVLFNCVASTDPVTSKSGMKTVRNLEDISSSVLNSQNLPLTEEEQWYLKSPKKLWYRTYMCGMSTEGMIGTSTNKVCPNSEVSDTGKASILNVLDSNANDVQNSEYVGYENVSGTGVDDVYEHVDEKENYNGACDIKNGFAESATRVQLDCPHSVGNEGQVCDSVAGDLEESSHGSFVSGCARSRIFLSISGKHFMH